MKLDRFNRESPLLTLAAAGLALPLGEVAWALSQQDLDFAWPTLSRGGFWALAAVLGAAWAWVQAGAWRWTFRLERLQALRIATASLLPALLGLLWKPLAAIHLPPPHHLTSRNLQILLAAQLVLGLWVALGLGLTAFKRSGLLQQWSPARAALRLGALAFFFFQSVGFWVGQWNMTGDAPVYLLVTHSLAYDHDMELADDYIHRDWKLFYDYKWDLERQLPTTGEGRDLSEHKAGLPMLLVPAYRLAGDSGARWMLALLAASATGLFLLLCLNLGYDRDLALLGWALFSFSSPWMSQSQNVMAEMIGGLGLVVALCALRGVLPASTGWTGIAYLSWIHVRFMPMEGVLTLLMAWKTALRSRLRAVSLMTLVGASLLLTFFADHLLFGSASPMDNRQMSVSMLFQPGSIFRFGAGILLDQEFGFLPYAPVFILAPLGLWALWRRERAWFWQSVLPGAGYFFVVASFPWWYSAMAPNRFMACLMPVVALWTLDAWRAWGHRRLFWGLAAASWALAMGLSVLPWLNYSKVTGKNWLLSAIEGKFNLNITDYLPSFFLNTSVSYVWAFGLGLALLYLGKKLGPPSLT